MSTPSHTPPFIVTEAATFIGIDYHKKYSVWHAVDAAGCDLGKRRIGKRGRLRLAEKFLFSRRLLPRWAKESESSPESPLHPFPGRLGVESRDGRDPLRRVRVVGAARRWWVVRSLGKCRSVWRRRATSAHEEVGRGAARPYRRRSVRAPVRKHGRQCHAALRLRGSPLSSSPSLSSSASTGSWHPATRSSRLRRGASCPFRR